MEEKPEQALPSNNKRQPILCEECKSNPWKYKCPGCSLRSCSLPCVNSHKQRTACTGKRPLTNFVPISQFDDNLLISDYNMLEDVKRVADSAQRIRVKLCGNWNSNFRLPFHLKSLRSAAASRRTKLQFLSNGMSKREMNRTCYDNRKKSISWTIEWKFHSTEVVLVDHGVNENTTLSSLIENHLNLGPWNHSLRKFCDESLDSLKFFIRKYPKGTRSPYRQLNIKAPIRDQLANLVILEYPVIHVFLPSQSYDFVIINDTNPRKVEIKEPTQHDYPSPQGVTFREEEIRDWGSLDPQVSDLLNHANEKSENPSPQGVTFREEEIRDRGSLDPQVSDLLNHANEKSETVKESKELIQFSPVVNGVKQARSVSHSDTCIAITEDNGIVSKSCIEQLADIGDLDFDFEPGLIDVYPDLIRDANSDDFLDFDGILLAEQNDMEAGEFLMDEELEEGEIA